MDHRPQPRDVRAERLRNGLFRYIPRTGLGSILLAGAGGFAVVYILTELTTQLGSSLLIAPFGASCVLVFGLPRR